MAGQYYRLPTSVSSNPSVGTNGATAPTSSTEIAGKTAGGLLVPVLVDASGNAGVNVASSALPTGASTATNQATEIASLSTIATNTTGVATAANQATTNSSLATIATASGLASTAALQTAGNLSLSNMDTKTPALGQALAAGSTPVVLPATQITSLTSANGATGSAVPANATQLAGSQSGTLKALALDGNGQLKTSAYDASSGNPVSYGLIGGAIIGRTQLWATSGAQMQGQSTMSLSVPVAIATDQSTLNMQGTVTANAGTGTFAVSAAALPLPALASTAANQTSVQSSPGTSAATAMTVQGSASGVAIPVSMTSAPTGSATSALQTSGNATLTAISGQLPTALGAKATAASLAVNIASDQTVPVSGTVTVASTTANQGTANSAANAWPIKVTDGTSVVPVKAGSTAPAAADAALVVSVSPNSADPALGSIAGAAGTKSYVTGGIYNSTLPTLTTGQQAAFQLDLNGRQILSPLTSTSVVTANQGAANATPWNSNMAQINGVAPLMGAGVGGTGSLRVNVASDQNVASNISQFGGTAVTLGQKAAASSIPVVLASGATISTSSSTGGTAIANAPVYNVYSTTNVLTSAYVQLIASTSNAASTVKIFDSSGQAMILAIGASGSEVVQVYVPPGGDAFTLSIPAGSRVAYKALTANATSGYLLISLLQ